MADVIVTPDNGGGPVVAIFDGSKLSQGMSAESSQMARFFGIDDPDFRGGARVAVGDLNGDGSIDMVVSAGTSGGPRVAIYDGSSITSGVTTPTKLRGDFFVYEETLRNGSYPAVGDVNGDGLADAIFGAGPRRIVTHSSFGRHEPCQWN